MTTSRLVLMTLMSAFVVAGCGSGRHDEQPSGSMLHIQVDAALVAALPPPPTAADSGPGTPHGTIRHANTITCGDQHPSHYRGGFTLSGDGAAIAPVVVVAVVVIGAVVLSGWVFDGLSKPDAHQEIHPPTYTLTLRSDTLPTAEFRLRNGQDLWVSEQTLSGIQDGSYGSMTLRAWGSEPSRPVQLVRAGRTMRIVPAGMPRP